MTINGNKKLLFNMNSIGNKISDSELKYDEKINIIKISKTTIKFDKTPDNKILLFFPLNEIRLDVVFN